MMEEKVTIRLIRNATLRIHYAGKEILVDPMLAGKGTLQSALGVYKTPRVHLTMPMNEIADGLDMVLLTHNHIDHYDPTVKQHLAKNILFLTQPQDKESITQDGFTNVESIEKDKAIGNLTIHRIQGHHGFGKIGEMMGPVSGYVLTAHSFPTIYIMSDCKWEDCIRQAIEQFSPDYIIVNSGGAIFPEFSQTEGSMDKIVNPERLVSVPFSKTRCGVDFYINSGYSSDVCGVLTENPVFKTDFFSFYFFRKANGYLLLNFRKFELHANMVLLLSPHQQQEWHVDEAELDYSFLIFREDFMRTFLADKFFVYRLLYYYQTDTPPYLFTSPESMAEYIRLLGIIKQELLHPVADTYNLIVSVLYYLLVIINRAYAATYHLPIDVPKNNYAFQFKDLLEKNIRTKQRVQEYADMLRVSRITLNSSVMSQFGVSANHLLKQRLLEELKNELLFANRNVNQLAEEFHFSDPSHLMRFFKRETGKTFTQYLRDYQNGIYE
jgi:AraC family transcriptional regulator, transcriptional activator of pobA